MAVAATWGSTLMPGVPVESGTPSLHIGTGLSLNGEKSSYVKLEPAGEGLIPGYPSTLPT
jgi:hypothetical protein